MLVGLPESIEIPDFHVFDILIIQHLVYNTDLYFAPGHVVTAVLAPEEMGFPTRDLRSEWTLPAKPLMQGEHHLLQQDLQLTDTLGKKDTRRETASSLSCMAELCNT